MPSMVDAHRSGIGGLAKLGDGVRANSDARTQAGLGRGPNQSKKLINAAWTDTFPAQGATLDLDFANDRGFVRGIGQGKSMDAVTFTRASNGNYVKADGTLSSHANQGALGNNLLTFPQDFDNAAWTKTNIDVVKDVGVAPDGNLTADTFTETTANGVHRSFATISQTGQVTLSVYVKEISGGRFFGLRINLTTISYAHTVFDLSNQTYNTSASVTAASISDVGDGWYRVSMTATNSTGGANPMVYLSDSSAAPAQSTIAPSYVGDGESGVFLWGAQLELGSTATEYFPTNIGQPRFDWASTASTGAGTIADPYVIPLAANPTSNGLLIEEACTNRILWCRDATQTQWVKTNVTAAKDQTGVDGVANAASSLTATANDGTCIQTITLASGSRTNSVYLTRLIGTGNCQVSLDGTTYSTVDLSASEWRRIVLSGTVTNPTVGIKLAVSGDAVAMDYGQVEDGAFVTTPILTTTATATRAVDVVTVGGVNFNSWFNLNKGTFFSTFNILGLSGERYPFFLGQNVTRRFDYRTSNAITFSAVGVAAVGTGLGFNQINKIAISYNSNAILINSVNAGISAIVQQFTKQQLSLDTNLNNLVLFDRVNGYLSKFTFIPTAATDKGVETLSSK